MGEFSDYYYTPEDAREEKRRLDAQRRKDFEAQIRADYVRRDAEEVRALYETRPNVFTTDPSRMPLWQLKQAVEGIAEHFKSIGQGIPPANLPLPDIDGTETIMNEELRINMSVTDILREEMQREALQKELDRKRALIADFGQDNYEEGTVIHFEKYFPQQGDKAKRYLYAAIKCDGRWFTTGPKATAGFTWTDLVLWLVEHPTLPTAADEVGILTEDTTVMSYAERNKPVAAIEGKVVEQPAKKATPRKRPTASSLKRN